MLAGQHGITRANCSQVRNALVAQGLGVRGRSCHRQLPSPHPLAVPQAHLPWSALRQGAVTAAGARSVLGGFWLQLPEHLAVDVPARCQCVLARMRGVQR